MGDPRQPALLRLAEVVRALTNHVAHSDPPEEAIARATRAAEEAIAALSPHAERRALPLYGGDAWKDDPNSFLPYSPVMGLYNPIAPPLRVTIEGGVVHAHARFGAAHEGPPRSVHGASVAAAFDQVLALVNVANGKFAMTGTLTVRYRKPTPLYTELRFEAHTGRVEGRKVYATSTLHAGDVLCAEAEGVFIGLQPGAF